MHQKATARRSLNTGAAAGKHKRYSAPGESHVKGFSDVGSIPTISTNRKGTVYDRPFSVGADRRGNGPHPHGAKRHGDVRRGVYCAGPSPVFPPRRGSIPRRSAAAGSDERRGAGCAAFPLPFPPRRGSIPRRSAAAGSDERRGAGCAAFPLPFPPRRGSVPRRSVAAGSDGSHGAGCAGSSLPFPPPREPVPRRSAAADNSGSLRGRCPRAPGRSLSPATGPPQEAS